MKAIVTGMITTYPVGGVVWDYGQYAVALEQMGWEVYYLEDTGGPTYDPNVGWYIEDCSYGVNRLPGALASISPTLGSRWHFRSMKNETFGIDAGEFHRIVAEADLFLNVSGGALLRDEYMKNPCKVLIDSDPGWNHFVNYPKWDATPGWLGTHGYRAHDHFFTYAARIGRPDCPLPDFGLKWIPTRPPVLMDAWSPTPPGETWTTVMTWDNFKRPIEHDGKTYGTKELEFPRFESLPSRAPAHFELATGGVTAPRDRWRSLGWRVVDSHAVSVTSAVYRDYIQSSRGEFSVAKNVYAATRCGWFSCRSVCYLAAARPVVTQDTGFSEFIPTGEGLFAFTELDEAVEAVKQIESDYPRHCRKAREVAGDCFDARKVLGDMIARSVLS